MLTDFKTLMVELNDEIAIIKLNNPPVNQLSTLLRTEMAAAFEPAFASIRKKGVALTGIGKNFMAGGISPRWPRSQIPCCCMMR